MIEVIDLVIQRLTGLIPGPIAHADYDWGQLDNISPENPPPVRFPCALVSLRSASFEDMHLPRQMGIFDLDITITCEKLTPTNPLAPSTLRNPALAVLNLTEQVHFLLHGWIPNDTAHRFGMLTRTGLRRIGRGDRLLQYQLTYKVQVN